MNELERPVKDPIYAICLAGRLSPDWSDWFDGMRITVAGEAQGAPKTLMVGTVKDQAALRSLLGRIWNLNLTILFVQRVQPVVFPGWEYLRPESTLGGSDANQYPGNK